MEVWTEGYRRSESELNEYLEDGGVQVEETVNANALDVSTCISQSCSKEIMVLGRDIKGRWQLSGDLAGKMLITEESEAILKTWLLSKWDMLRF